MALMLSYRSFLVIPLAILLCCKDSVLKPFTENGLWGFKDADGNIRIEAKYDDTGAFSKGLARVRLGNILTGKYGFINTKGEEVITLKYDYVEEFSEGLVLVRLNGKYGFINPKGEVVIPFKYSPVEGVSQFKDGLAFVIFNGQWGFIDKSGNEYWTEDEGKARRQMKNR